MKPGGWSLQDPAAAAASMNAAGRDPPGAAGGSPGGGIGGGAIGLGGFTSEKKNVGSSMIVCTTSGKTGRTHAQRSTSGKERLQRMRPAAAPPSATEICAR